MINPATWSYVIMRMNKRDEGGGNIKKAKLIILLTVAVIIIIATVVILTFVFQENSVRNSFIEVDYNTIYDEAFARGPAYIICARFEEKRWHLNCTEYVFEITEVLKGNLSQKEISTYERKMNWFQKSDFEVWLEPGEFDAVRGRPGYDSYVVGEEYLLTPGFRPDDSSKLCEGWGNYIPLNDLENAYSMTKKFLNKFTTLEIENPTRDEFVSFLKGIIEEYSVADEHEYPEGPISLPSDNQSFYIAIACSGAGVVVLCAALVTYNVVGKKRKRKLPPE